MKTMNWAEFSSRYCDTQEQTPGGLLAVLQSKAKQFAPDGFFLAECQMLDSPRVGTVVILLYGPQNTFKTPPTAPFSPRGLASDQSVCIGILPIDALPMQVLPMA